MMNAINWRTPLSDNCRQQIAQYVYGFLYILNKMYNLNQIDFNLELTEYKMKTFKMMSYERSLVGT